LIAFAQGEIVCGDVLFGFWKALLRNRKLVHEAETKVMLFAGEIYGAEGTKVLAGFPADLFAKAGCIAGGSHIAKVAQELEQDCLEEVPIFGTTGKRARSHNSSPLLSSI